MDSRLHIGPVVPTPDPTGSAPWNISSINPHRLMEVSPVAPADAIVPAHVFPTVNVPAHAHYTIGVVILAVGITGMLGNFLVIYAFSRSRSLRTPSNIFIINLAVTDFLMCLTQTPIFFITSMHKHWIFGKKGCELYAFCGALFGICSMMTLMVIAVDRYVVITRPLASLGVMSHRKALCFVAAAWLYSMGWSLPPFFGWSAYVPEGLMTSCSWDYMTFTPSVRSYTMLLFTFVFFIPLFIIIFCYCGIFRAIRHTTRAISKINCEGRRDSAKRFHKMRSEWKMAKIALIVILLFVISWAPYSCAALTAFHSDSVNRYVPYLGMLLCISGRDRYSSSSLQSTRRSTLTSQSECKGTGRHRTSSQSESESAHFSDTEEDCSSQTPAGRHSSADVKQVRHASQRSKVSGHNAGAFERTAALHPTDPAICHLSQLTLDSMMREPGPKTVSKNPSSIIVASISTPSILHSPPGFHGSLKVARTVTPVSKELLDIARLETTTALP
uniref:G-protein coupled receptors family 1 profile domain-containing protein n=1 Tax=Poecilia mexicana TaxID=48701 RepID=A0A3B3WYH7_9TELE